MKCQQITGKGTRCKRNALPTEKFCGLHVRVSANRANTNINFGKMLMVSLTGIIRTIIKTEINSLSIHAKD